MTRHQKIVRVSDKVLASWLEDLLPDLPDEFRVVGSRWHHFKGTIDFLVESKDFPETPESAEPEVLEY